jgi:hypothetical protein
MLQLSHAGIVAVRRQLAAVIVISLILLLAAPVNETFWLSATPFLTWGYLLMAAGFALTSDQSIDITASRIYRGSYLMQLVAPKHALKALVAQFGVAAVLFAILGLRPPPQSIIVVAQYLGCGSAASVIWAAVMSVGVACFGASTHAVLKAIEIDNHEQ